MAKATTKKAAEETEDKKPAARPAPAAKAAPKAEKATTAAAKPAARGKKATTAASPANKGVDGAHKGVTASPDLAKIIGDDSMKRTEVVSRVWDYVRKHNLQNPADKREIIADENLKKVFGRDRATMFEMNKLVFAHLK